MHIRSTPTLFIALAFLALLPSACGGRSAPAPDANTTGISTGIRELDAVVAASLSGDTSALLPYLEYTSALCTTEQGLGGPPKCLPGEHDGTPVNVLPFLGPGEGSFVRELDAPSWVAPRLTRLYAAYKVSHGAYSDPNYPAGDYALVFATGDASPSPVTLQVTQGRIVRIDYGAGWPPQIPPDDVELWLVAPSNTAP